MSLDLAIKDDIAFEKFNHNVVPVVIWYIISLWESGKTGLHLPWNNTSQSIECESIQYH